MGNLWIQFLKFFFFGKELHMFLMRYLPKKEKEKEKIDLV